MLLAAPGRFSITKGWPSRSCSHCPISRATMSLPPPGVKPTIQRTGRDGKACADAKRGPAARAAAIEQTRVRRSGVMITSTQANLPSTILLQIGRRRIEDAQLHALLALPAVDRD